MIFVLPIAAIVIAFLGYIFGRYDKDYPSVNDFVNKHSRGFRIVIALIFLAGLIIYIEHLVTSSPKTPEIELAKLVFSALVVLGLIYSILTFEFNVKKSRQTDRIQKSLTTYSAISAWQTSPMIDHSHELRIFENSTNFPLLKGDMKTFESFFDHPSQAALKRSVIAIFNYFELIGGGIAEDILDEGFVKRFFNTVFRLYYDDWIEYVKKRRLTEDAATLWIDFTTLVEKWKKK